MRRLAAIVGSVLFLLVAPGLVAGVVPYWIERWRFGAALGAGVTLRIIGASLIAAGLPLLLDSFTRFALQGLGTPAPVFPTKHLVITGFYRYVRNPMYLGVAMVIFGQGLLFGNVRVIGYGVLVCIAFQVFILLYEEPTLRRTFGAQYEEFCRNVPRWIPRLKPWIREQPDPGPGEV